MNEKDTFAKLTQSTSAAEDAIKKWIQTIDADKLYLTSGQSISTIKDGAPYPQPIKWWRNPREWRRQRKFRKRLRRNFMKGVDKDAMFSYAYSGREERIKKRRKFRLGVSRNRMWMMISLAVVVVSITLIYFSVTYGSPLILKFLGIFK